MTLSIYIITMDWSSAAAAAVSAAGNIAGTLFGKRKAASLARQNAAYGYQLARENARLAPSIEIEGYRRAGVNPFAEGAAQIGDWQGTSVDTPSGEMSNLGSMAVQAFQNERVTQAQANMMNSQEELNYVNSEVGKENINYIMAQTKCSKQTAQNLAVEFFKIQQETDNLKALKQRIVSEIALNNENVNLSQCQQRYYDMNTKSIKAYVEQKLPRELEKMNSEIDVNATMSAINRIKFQEISQKVTLQEMDIMQASEALADNIKAAGIDAQKRLAEAYLGLTGVNIDKFLANNPAVAALRISTRMIGMMSSDVHTDLVGNLTSAFANVGGRVAGAAIAAGAL